MCMEAYVEEMDVAVSKKPASPSLDGLDVIAGLLHLYRSTRSDAYYVQLCWSHSGG